MVELDGVIKFADDLTMTQVRLIKPLLGMDIRDHGGMQRLLDDPDGFRVSRPVTGEHDRPYYIDLKFNDDYSGLEWDGSEKSRDIDTSLNLIMDYMWSTSTPIDFMDGDIQCMDHGYDYATIIEVRGNFAKEVPVKSTGDDITCPNCDHTFTIGTGE